MENNSSPVPSVIPPQLNEEAQQRSRVTFSSDAGKLSKRRIETRSSQNSQSARSQSRRTPKSSQLLEDLMRHPLDPLFEDATLTAHTISRTQRIITHIISFILCVVVGFGGSQAVRILQGQSREKVRAQLAAQLVATTKNAQDLENTVKKQQKELLNLTRQTKNEANTISKIRDSYILTAQSAVRGSGITMTLTNPSTDDSATKGRVTDGQSNALVSDAQLQYILSLLWQAGAEAISINDVRIGPQTAVRSAGGTMLVGITAVQTPYVIRAIGNAQIMQNAVDSSRIASVLFTPIGVSMTVNHSKVLDLPAANAVSIERARKE